MPAINPGEEVSVKWRKRAKPFEDKTATAQRIQVVAPSTCKKTTVLLFISQTALLLFLIAFVVVSLTKLSALQEELNLLQISSKSGICWLLRLK